MNFKTRRIGLNMSEKINPKNIVKEVTLNARLLLLNPNGIKLIIDEDMPIGFKVSKKDGTLIIKMVVI